MGLFKKIFRNEGAASSSAPLSTQYHDSDGGVSTGQPTPESARRETLHMVLSDSIRRHGIPSGWLDCEILPGAGAARMHLHLIVRQGHDRLLAFVPAFQRSFMEELERMDPRVNDWLLSVSWQFDGLGGKPAAAMPDPKTWSGFAAHLSSTTAVPVAHDDELTQDLKALYAIRDAAMRPPADPLPRGHGHSDFEATEPGAGR